MAIRYKRLGYVALNVSDLDRSEDFYSRLVGLESMGRGPDDCRFLRCSGHHYDIALHKGATPGLKRIGFEMESLESLLELEAALKTAGVATQRVPAEECADYKLRNCVRAVIPHIGATFDFYETMREHAGRPFVPTVAKIQRLGHFVLKTDEYEAAVEFMKNVLNFRVSDEVEGFITFMRCWPNPFHHSIGIGRGKRKAMHHVNFMVTEVDDIGKAMWRFQKENVPVVNGPGRHPPSGSMFYYYLDPDNLTVEYSFGMEEFPEEKPRKPRVLEAVSASIDFWGAPSDARKSEFGEIETGTM
jgi:2,3-dihydroxy-p-cumate/2,3-dihydroxybenzoate 3,4-dioxygenase